MCIMFEVPTVKTVRGVGFKNLGTPYYDVITSRNDVLRCTTNSTCYYLSFKVLFMYLRRI